MKHNRFDISALDQSKIQVISTAEALKDVTPIQWSQDVLDGKAMVVITEIRIPQGVKNV